MVSGQTTPAVDTLMIAQSAEQGATVHEIGRPILSRSGGAVQRRGAASLQGKKPTFDIYLEPPVFKVKSAFLQFALKMGRP